MSTTDRSLDWLLENLLEKTPGTRHALVLSRDGLKLCLSSGLTVDQADQLSAIASGIQSLSHGASMEAGVGAHLAVIADDEADAGVVGHNMNELIEQIGEYLRAEPRQSA